MHFGGNASWGLPEGGGNLAGGEHWAIGSWGPDTCAVTWVPVRVELNFPVGCVWAPHLCGPQFGDALATRSPNVPSQLFANVFSAFGAENEGLRVQCAVRAEDVARMAREVCGSPRKTRVLHLRPPAHLLRARRGRFEAGVREHDQQPRRDSRHGARVRCCERGGFYAWNRVGF